MLQGVCASKWSLSTGALCRESRSRAVGPRSIEPRHARVAECKLPRHPTLRPRVAEDRAYRDDLVLAAQARADRVVGEDRVRAEEAAGDALRVRDLDDVGYEALVARGRVRAVARPHG